MSSDTPQTTVDGAIGRGIVREDVDGTKNGRHPAEVLRQIARMQVQSDDEINRATLQAAIQLAKDTVYE